MTDSIDFEQVKIEGQDIQKEIQKRGEDEDGKLTQEIRKVIDDDINGAHFLSPQPGVGKNHSSREVAAEKVMEVVKEAEEETEEEEKENEEEKEMKMPETKQEYLKLKMKKIKEEERERIKKARKEKTEEDSNTYVFVSSSHQHNQKQKEALINEHGYYEQFVKMIKGWKRKYPLYPEKEDENLKLVPWSEADYKEKHQEYTEKYSRFDIGFEEFKETCEQVKQHTDNYNRVSKSTIHSKLGDDLVLNEYEEQFKHMGGIVLLTKPHISHRKIKGELFNNSKAIFVDEEVTNEKQDISFGYRRGRSREAVSRLLNVIRENKQIFRILLDEDSELVDELNFQSGKFWSIIGDEDKFFREKVDELEKLLYEEENWNRGLLDKIDEFNEKLKSSNVLFNGLEDPVPENQNSKNYSRMISYTQPGIFEKNNPLSGKERKQLRDLDTMFSVALNILYEEEEPEEYRECFKYIPNFRNLARFAEIVQYHDIEVSERIKRVSDQTWKEIKKNGEIRKEWNNKGLIAHEGQIKAYKIGENNYISEIGYNPESDKEVYATYWKPVFFDLIPPMNSKPVFFLNATFDEKPVDLLLDQYKESFRPRKLSVQQKEGFEEVMEELDDVDRFLIHQTRKALGYISRSGDLWDIDRVLREVSKGDISFRVYSTDVENPGVTLERVTKSRTNKGKKGTFTRSSASIQTMKRKLDRGKVPDQLKYIGQSDRWVLASFLNVKRNDFEDRRKQNKQKKFVKKLREETDYFDDDNTASFFSDRGKDLDGNIWRVGTPYPRPDVFQNKVKRIYKIGYGWSTTNLEEVVKDQNGWYGYNESKSSGIQEIFETVSKDEAYQMDHRGRPLLKEDGKIVVQGLVTEKEKDEFEFKDEGRNEKEVIVEDILEFIDEKIGRDNLVNKALEEGITPEEITEEGMEILRYHENALQVIAQKYDRLTYDGDKLRSKKYKKKFTVGEVVKIVDEWASENPKVVKNCDTKTELKEKIAESTPLGENKASKGVKESNLIVVEVVDKVPPETKISLRNGSELLS